MLVLVPYLQCSGSRSRKLKSSKPLLPTQVLEEGKAQQTTQLYENKNASSIVAQLPTAATDCGDLIASVDKV